LRKSEIKIENLRRNQEVFLHSYRESFFPLGLKIRIDSLLEAYLTKLTISTELALSRKRLKKGRGGGDKIRNKIGPEGKGKFFRREVLKIIFSSGDFPQKNELCRFSAI